MIPMQTEYLRKKNDELLHILEENATHLNRKVEICSMLLRGRPPYRREEFTQYCKNSPDMSPTSRFNQNIQPVTTSHSTRPHRSSSAIQIRSTSAKHLHSPQRGHSTCLPSQPVSQESSRDNRWSKLQQDLACHAHMHGYTLSHALSKCYCTRKDGSDTGISLMLNSRIVPEPSSRKSRIPSRVKEKRYQADSAKGELCSVKWAVPNEPELDISRLPQDSYRIHSPRKDCNQDSEKQAAPCCGSLYAQGDVPLPMKIRCATSDELNSESDSEWFTKVKNFRKSNWEDCHAPERRKKDTSDCNCNRVYMIGERMFLEPVSSSLNKQCCSSRPLENPNPSPRDKVVTLPTVRPGKRGNSPKREENRPSEAYTMERPCFLTGHKIRHDDYRSRVFVQQRPPDSFALRYQKGVDPRKPFN